MVSVVPVARLATVLTPPLSAPSGITVLNTNGSELKNYPVRGDPSEPVWSPDGNTIYFVASNATTTNSQRIYALNVGDGATRIIADTVAALTGAKLVSPAISRDGSWLYFAIPEEVSFDGQTVTSGEIWR